MKRVLYKAKECDTLWGIARDKLGDPNRYREIKEWNKMSGLALKPGQILVLYIPEIREGS